MHITGTSVDNQCIESYVEQLKRLYKTASLPSEGLSEKLSKDRIKICRLAMIKNEEVCRHAVDDEFVKQTITGKIDDILHTKTPVELKDIFEGLPEGRKMILVEGAPGAGKSSLSFDICKKWSEGELFQQYKAVILVRLRDPQVQKAKRMSDLLPACCNVTRAQQVESAIKAVHGRDVLWILDGWDEFPDNLKNEHSLLRKSSTMHVVCFQHLIKLCIHENITRVTLQVQACIHVGLSACDACMIAMSTLSKNLIVIS